MGPGMFDGVFNVILYGFFALVTFALAAAVLAFYLMFHHC